MNDVFDRLAALLPNLLAAAALLVAGWLAARLLRAGALRGGRALRLGAPAALLATIVFWLVLLAFVIAAADALGLPTVTGWLARLVEYLPTLAAGLLIVVAGYVLAAFIADLVRAAAVRLAPDQRNALARLAQGATLTMALLVGADQVGIKVTWLAILAALVLGGVLGGVTLAVSFGARGYVENLIGAHYLRQAFRIGQRVRVAGFEGRILQVTQTALVLQTGEGRVSLPGRLYHDQPIVLLDDG